MFNCPAEQKILQDPFIHQVVRACADLLEERIGQCLFAYLHVKDHFLDRVGGHKAVAEYRLALTNPMGAVYCLTLDRRVSLMIIEDHRVGLGQGQPDTSDLAT